MPWLTARRLVLAALAVWLAVTAIGLWLGPPLGHDEAAFAAIARGDAPPWFWLYRSSGTVAIARLGVALGGAEWQVRLLSAALSPAVVIAVFAVGRAAFTARTGAWAAAVIAGAHPMVLRGYQLLSDLPATACLLGGMAVLIGELERDGGPRWRLVWAAPLLAAALYLRYGSAPVLAVVGVAAVVLWWRAIAARPLRALATAAVFAALLVPHFLNSVDATGAALGILRISAGMPRRAYVGEGLVTYLTSNPLEFYGALAGPVMVAGVIGLVRARRRAPWYLAIVGFGQLVALGLESHGQPRYVFVAVSLLVVLGCDALRRLERPRLAALAVAAAWLGAVAGQIVGCRAAQRSRAPIVRAAQVIDADAAGRPCAVAAPITPQLAWYSRCVIGRSTTMGEPLPADRVRYVAAFGGGAIELPRVLAYNPLRAVPLPTGDPGAQVWRLE
jgi:hypothetical protein